MLRLLGSTWAAVGRLRARLYRDGWLRRRHLGRPVISVGALEVGGSGKTPAAAMVAALLADAGLRPAILSRGYRREGAAPLLVSRGDGSGPHVGPGAAGDEPFWLASVLPAIPVAVAKRREEAAALVLAAAAVDVFVLDDGFQHLRVARDADLLVVDATAAFWRQPVMPAGRLREAPAAAARADAFLLLGAENDAAEVLRRRHPGAPAFAIEPQAPRAWAHGRPLPAATAAGGSGVATDPPPAPLYAFAAIARPERFFAALRAAGLPLAGQRAFPDHHVFSPRELDGLATTARDAGAAALVTTEKDAVRVAAPPAGVPLYVWSYRLAPRDPGALLEWLFRSTALAPAPAAAAPASPAAAGDGLAALGGAAGGRHGAA